MKPLCAVAILLACMTSSLAQVPDTLWTRAYGSPNESMSMGFAVVALPDGGCAAMGFTRLPDGEAYSLVRTDQNGNPLWERIYRDTGFGYSLALTQDHGFIMAGTHPGSFILVKTDSLGNLQWRRSLRVDVSLDGGRVIQTQDGGYAICGRSYYEQNMYLMRADRDGNLLWGRSYGGTGNDFAESVAETPEGGFLLAGSSNSYNDGLYRLIVVKTDAAGNPLWTNSYGQCSLDAGNAMGSIQVLPGNSYLLTGAVSWTANGPLDALLVKIDSTGAVIWSRTYGGAENENAQDAHLTPDGGFVVVGYTESFGAAAEDIWILKTDGFGNLQWRKSFGGPMNDVARAVDVAADGSYYVIGNTGDVGPWTAGRMYLIKIGPGDSPLAVSAAEFSAESFADGIHVHLTQPLEMEGCRFELWRRTESAPEFAQIVELPFISLNSDGLNYNYIDYEVAIGHTYEYLMVEINPAGYRNERQNLLRVVTFDGGASLPGDFSLQVYPNPFNSAATIAYFLPEKTAVKVSVLDILGRQVQVMDFGVQSAARHEMRFDGSSLASGTYFVNVQAGSVSISQKIIMIK